MKTCFLITLTIACLLGFEVRSQNYLLELSPKYSYAQSTKSNVISLDAQIFLTNHFSIGGCYYFRWYPSPSTGYFGLSVPASTQAFGVNFQFTSDRQKRFRYYTNVKIIYWTGQATGSTGTYAGVPVTVKGSDFGGIVGGGISYALGRIVALNMEFNYVVAGSLVARGPYGLNEGEYTQNGFLPQIGIVFRMFRRK